MAGALQRVRAVIDEPRLLRLLDYWSGKRHGELLPARADIDPVELRFILGYLILVDVARDPLRFRYRLVGSSLQLSGRNLTGTWLDQHPDPTFRALAHRHYAHVADSGTPWAVRHNRVMDGRPRHYQALLLPLAADGRTVDMVMVGQYLDVEKLNLAPE